MGVKINSITFSLKIFIYKNLSYRTSDDGIKKNFNH